MSFNTTVAFLCMQSQQGWDGMRCNNPSEQIPVGDRVKGTKSYKTTAIAWSNFKWSYWKNSQKHFPRETTPPTISFYPLTLTPLALQCPEVPCKVKWPFLSSLSQCWTHTMSCRAVSSPQVMFSSLLLAETSHSPVCSSAATPQFGDKLSIL